MKVFSDILGEYIDLPSEDQLRIISLAPSVTDSLFYIGANDKLIGISYFCKYPPETKDLPRIGGYLNVNYDILSKLKPNLIFTTTGIQRKLTFELRKRGFNVYPIPLPISTFDIINNLMLIGVIVGKAEFALKRSVELYEQLVSLYVPEVKANVYYEVDLGEPITIGKYSYINTSLRLIGLANIFSNYCKSYFNPNYDVVRENNPDLIIYEARSEDVSIEDVERRFKSVGLNSVSAIKNGKILLLKPDTLAHYGPMHISFLKEIKKEVNKLLG